MHYHMQGVIRLRLTQLCLHTNLNVDWGRFRRYSDETLKMTYTTWMSCYRLSADCPTFTLGTPMSGCIQTQIS